MKVVSLHGLLAAVFRISVLVARAGPVRAELARPNIFWIVIDDLGVGEPGCYGGRLPTPNLDRLSREGIRFSEAYVTAPYCAPSRASLLTGRRCSRIGFEFNPVGPQNEDPRAGLALSETRVASRLKLAGYATSALGSGTWGRHLPTTRSGVVLTNSLVFSRGTFLCSSAVDGAHHLAEAATIAERWRGTLAVAKRPGVLVHPHGLGRAALRRE